MPNEIGDITTVTVPAPGTPGPGYATTINAAIEELQARVSQRADNGSIAQMPAGTVKVNLTGALADAQDVTLATLSAALGGGSGAFGYYTAADIGLTSDPTHSTATGDANRDAWLAFENAHATENLVIDLSSKTAVDYPFTKRVGSAASIRYSRVAVGGGTPESAVTGSRLIRAGLGNVKLTQCGTGLGSFHLFELAFGIQNFTLEGLILQQDSIFPWQVSHITRPLGTAGTYTLTVSGDGITTTPVSITIAAAEPNDTTIANIQAGLQAVVGRNYTATIAGGVGVTYVRVEANIGPTFRFSIVSSAPTIINSDNVSEEQLHLVHVKNGVGAVDNNRNIAFRNCHFLASIGAGFKGFGEAGQITDGLEIDHCYFDARATLIGAGVGGRSCVEFQRGLSNVKLTNSTLKGARNSCLDCEITAVNFFADYSQENLLIENVTVDNSFGLTSVAFSLGGVNSLTYRNTGSPEGVQVAALGDLYLQATPSGQQVVWKKLSAPTTSTGWVATPNLDDACMLRGCVVRNVKIVEGSVTQLYTRDVTWEDCRIEYTGGINAAVDALGIPTLYSLTQQNVNTKLSNVVLWRGPNAPAGTLLNVAGAANSVVSGSVPDAGGETSRRPFSVTFDGCYGYNASLSYIGTISDCDGLTFANGNLFEMNRGAIDGTNNTAIVVTAINHDVANFTIEPNGLKLRSVGAYKWTVGLAMGCGVGVARRFKNLALTGLDYAEACSTSSASGCGFVFDLSAGALAVGSGYDASPLVQGNRGGSVKNTWIASNSAANKLFPVIAGSQGSLTRRTLEGTITPNTNVVGNLGDEYQFRPTTTTSQTWRKDSQSVAGTPDNSGWVQLTVGGAGTAFSGDYTAVAGRGHNLRVKNFLVTDAAVSPTSRISVNWAPTTDLDENTPDAANVRFAAFSVGAGAFTIQVISNDNKPISGDYKLIYQVS